MRVRPQKVIGYLTNAWVSDAMLEDLGADFVYIHLEQSFRRQCRAANLTLIAAPEIIALDREWVRAANADYRKDDHWRNAGTEYRITGRVVRHIGRPFKR
jgi:hypothetical protein